MDNQKTETNEVVVETPARERLTIEVPSEINGGATCVCTCVVCDPSVCATCHSGKTHKMQ